MLNYDYIYKFDDSSLFGEESPRQIAEWIISTTENIVTPQVWQVRDVVLSKITTTLYQIAEEENNEKLKKRLVFHFGEWLNFKQEPKNKIEKAKLRLAYRKFAKELACKGLLLQNIDLVRAYL